MELKKWKNYTEPQTRKIECKLKTKEKKNRKKKMTQ